MILTVKFHLTSISENVRFMRHYFSCLKKNLISKSQSLIYTSQQLKYHIPLFSEFIEKLGRKVGYARVSTDDQELGLQIDALIKSGCSENLIYTDKISGAKNSRPGLDICLDNLSSGDTLIVWRLDRLGRSMSHLVNLIESLLEKKIGFKSIQDGAIDTTTASGELMFNIFSALAQFERRLIQERTNAGLSAARARGKVGGRPKLSPNNPKVRMAQEMNKNRSLSINEICSSLKISRATFYRYISLNNNLSS